jgi:hypothetical protein
MSVKCMARMCGGRVCGHYHLSDEPLVRCPVCDRLIIRWSLMESPVARDWWRIMIRKGLLS